MQPYKPQQTWIFFFLNHNFKTHWFPWARAAPAHHATVPVTWTLRDAWTDVLISGCRSLSTDDAGTETDGSTNPVDQGEDSCVWVWGVWKCAVGVRGLVNRTPVLWGVPITCRETHQPLISTNRTLQVRESEFSGQFYSSSGRALVCRCQ